MADPSSTHPYPDQTTPDQTTVARGSRRPRRGVQRLGALLVAATLGLGMPAAAPAAQAAAPGFCADGSQPYVPVSEVESWNAGASVTGLTVSKGTTPEGFTGSYIGSIDDALGKGKTLLLFRLSNPTIDGTNGLKPAGIWAGMSGSPVYAPDGRLIGAVSYSLNADNLPVAGVTPAEYMKSIGSTGIESAAQIRLTSANLKASPAAARVAGTALSGTALTPIKTVNIAGQGGAGGNAFANRTLARTPRTAGAAALLRSRSFMAAPKQTASVSQPLVAGGNVAALFGSGDLVSGSIGTVTAICGSTVWAFGHPMTQQGKVSMQLANASIAMVVPDATGIVGSYKQVSAFGPSIGMVTQDRTAGLRGTVGAVTSFPISVAVQDAGGKQIASYSGTLSDQEVAPSAAAYLIGQAATEQLDQAGAGTGKVTWTIKFRRANGATGSLTNSQVVSDRELFSDELGSPAGDDIWTIVNQDVENVTITSIKATVKLISADALAYKVTRVERLRKGKWTALSGSKLKAGTSYTLRPTFRLMRNGKPAQKVIGSTFTAKLSASARSRGSMKIAALTGESDSCEVTSSLIVLCSDWGDPEEPDVSSFNQLLAQLSALPSNAGLRGTLSYRLTKGSTVRLYSWTGPGPMSGRTSADFTIKK
ncbi:MAG: hypothetical protein QM582_12320 [Micropruina sp.]|uniref:hypothetical protein n=1 Tax=Micropruina sp. TaxID=2737536 RepID=UPI0039E32B76